MQSVITLYQVISGLPIVVEDEVGVALSYAPGAVFQALSKNKSVVRLLSLGHIVQTSGIDLVDGYVIVQGPTGPSGAISGWERTGTLVRLVTASDQVSAGIPVPAAQDKFSIDAAVGGFTTGILLINGDISVPHTGTGSERFGLGATAGGNGGTALGASASASATSTTAGGNGATATGNFGSAWGAAASAIADGTAAGASSTAGQSGTAIGKSSSATGLRAYAGGASAVNSGQDSILLGANGSVTADEVVIIGSSGSGTAAGAQAVGFNTTASGIDSSAWGRGATSTFAGSHAWGAGATTTAVNQVVFGANSNPIAQFHLGKGEAAITSQDIVVSSSRISTTQADEAGSNLLIVAGPGTGNAAPSTIQFRAAPAGASGNAQQVLATQMTVGEGVGITNWLNVGPTTLANSVGDIAATDGTTTFEWDATTPQLNLGVEGAITRIRGIDAVVAGVDGGSLYLVSGTGRTTGGGGATHVLGGDSGAAGIGGLAALKGGSGVASGGPVEVIGGSCIGAAGGPLTLSGGPGAPAGNSIFQGGITNGIGGQSGTGTFSGGDASATQISLAGDAILKGGDGISNNNHGAHAYIRGGVGFGAGTHGRVQIETAGVGRWQVDNTGQMLAVADTAYDIGATASGRPRDLFVGRDAVIDGNLTVNGTTTTINSEIQTADNYVLLNAEYTSDAPQTAGLVLNIDPAATSFTISDIASDVVTVGAGDPSAVLSAGDFVLLQNPANPANAGIFEVLSTTITSITIDTTPIEPFSGSGLIDDATVQGVIVGTKVAVHRADTSGVFEEACGTAAPLVYQRPGLLYTSALIDFSVSGTATGLIPIGSLPASITTRVLTTISGGGATGYEVGDTGDVDRWGSIAALTAGTTSTPADFTDNTLSFNNSASAEDVILTGIGGTPTAGTVRVLLAYMSFAAPTS